MNYTPDGTAVCKFSIAVSKKVKGNEETTWYNCIAWRNLAEMLSTHLKKGQMVFVQGDLQVRQYTTRDGKNGVSLDVTVDKFQFAGGRRDESVTTRPDMREAVTKCRVINFIGDIWPHRLFCCEFLPAI
jgi:single-strand DNA-binding protein